MSTLNEYLERGCFLILDRFDKPVGAGFVVAENFSITCEHLLCEPYFASRPERVSIVFPDGRTRRLAVTKQTGHDVVGLIGETFAQPLGLGHLIGTDRNETDRLLSFGLSPNKKLKSQISGYGSRFGDGDCNRRLIAFNNSQIGPGFSGGPVLDRWTGQVVGIIIGGDEMSPAGKYGQGIFALPTQVILDCFETLSLKGGPLFARYKSRISNSLVAEHQNFVSTKLTLSSSGVTADAEETLVALICRGAVAGISGPSGLGKSTLLCHIACRLSRDETLNRVPVLLSLKDALTSRQTGEKARLLEAALNDETFYSSRLWDFEEPFDPILVSESLDRLPVFLIDGVDEATRDGTNRGTRFLQETIRAIRDWKFAAVVAAREPSALALKDTAIPWYELLGFDERSQEQFISFYPQLGPRTKAKLARLPKGILERPLLLKLAVESVRDDDDIESVISLYTRYFEYEIGRIFPQNVEKQIILLRLIEEIALKLWESPQEARLDVIKYETLKLVSESLGATRISCEATLQECLDILNRARTLLWTHRGVIRWGHSSFQEFLVAQAKIKGGALVTVEIVQQVIRQNPDLIDYPAYIAALLPVEEQQKLLDIFVQPSSSRSARNVAARAISFGVGTLRHKEELARLLLVDLQSRCKGDEACSLLWTSFSGDTSQELERLLDVGALRR